GPTVIAVAEGGWRAWCPVSSLRTAAGLGRLATDRRVAYLALRCGRCGVGHESRASDSRCWSGIGWARESAPGVGTPGGGFLFGRSVTEWFRPAVPSAGCGTGCLVRLW